MKFAKSLLVVTLLGVLAACGAPKKTESVSETPPKSTADTIVMVVDKAELRKIALEGWVNSKVIADSINKTRTVTNDTLPQAYSSEWFCDDAYQFTHRDDDAAGLLVKNPEGGWGIRSPLWVGTAVKLSTSNYEKDEFIVEVTNITSNEKRLLKFFIPTQQCLEMRIAGGVGGFIDALLPNSVADLIGWDGMGNRLGDAFLIQARNNITSISAIGGGPNAQ